MKHMESDTNAGANISGQKLPGFLALARQAIGAYRDKRRVLVHLQMASFAGSILIGTVIALIWQLGYFTPIFFDSNAGVILKSTAAILAALLFIAILFFMSLIDAAMIVVLRDKQSAFGWAEAVRKAAPYVLPCMLAGTLVLAAVAAATSLFFLPGAIVAVWLMPAKYLIVAGNYNWLQALTTSRNYTRGFFWDLLLLSIMGMVSSFFTLTILSNLLLLPLGDLLNLVATTLVWPIFPTYHYLVFDRLRALNLDKIREAPKAIDKRITLMAGAFGAILIFMVCGTIANNGPAMVTHFKNAAQEIETRNQNLLRQMPMPKSF